MIRNEIFEKCAEHKHALIFAAGIATAIVGKKIIESKTVKDAATQGMASVMSVRKDAEECFQDMKKMLKRLYSMHTKKTKKKSTLKLKSKFIFF